MERRDSLRTEDLLEILKETKSISKTLKDKIESLRSSILKMDVRNASAFHISSIEALFNKSSQNLAKRIRDIVDSGFAEIVSHVNYKEMENHIAFRQDTTTTKFELAEFRKKYDNDIKEISGLVRKSYKNALSDIKYDMQESSCYVLKKYFDSVLLDKFVLDPENYIDKFKNVDYRHKYEAIVNIQINVIRKIVSSIYATIKKDSQDIDTMLNIKDD